MNPPIILHVPPLCTPQALQAELAQVKAELAQMKAAHAAELEAVHAKHAEELAGARSAAAAALAEAAGAIASAEEKRLRTLFKTALGKITREDASVIGSVRR